MLSFLFLLNATPTPEIYTLSLHDALPIFGQRRHQLAGRRLRSGDPRRLSLRLQLLRRGHRPGARADVLEDRKSTRLNSSHVEISYAVFCLKKKKKSLKRV